MATNVHMEALSPTMEEGQLVRWLKQEGDAVSEGDVLAEIETDKATMELVARGSGVLRNVQLEAGGTAAVGTVIATIAGEDEDVAAVAGDEKKGVTSGAAAAERRPASGEPSEEKEEKEEEEASEEETGEEEAEEEGEVAPAAAKGGKQPKGEREEGAGEERAAPRAAKGRPPAEMEDEDRTTTRTGDAERPDGRVKASPLARRLASEAGLELADVRGSGPGGRITRADIEAAMKTALARPAAGTRAAAPAGDGQDTTEVPLSQMRKAIAKRLVTSIGPVPTFYLTIDVDVGRTLELRERVNARLEKEGGGKASINDFVIRAVAAAIARHPEVNASWGESVILRHNRVHIGVAVAIEDGLITPVIRDADRKGVGEIAREVRELAGRAREKKLKPDEYTGATFSVSNLGMFGIHEFTALINPPESAILAVGAAEDVVVAVDGQPAVRTRMRMTMSCDHRVIDGATGAKFLQTLKEFLTEPMLMLA
jgi:pyruvate dehydrogenase E2 component (dihydrolipoamide acetyltransferase)